MRPPGFAFLEGILDGAIREYYHEDWGRSYNFDWERVNAFWDGFWREDFSNSEYTARAWEVVLAYLLMDYRYLYL